MKRGLVLLALAAVGAILALRAFTALMDAGAARNVLGGGPMAALAHLVAELAADPLAPPLAAGEIVSTGTLTRALPVAAGERWSTRLAGLSLPDFALGFA